MVIQEIVLLIIFLTSYFYIILLLFEDKLSIKIIRGITQLILIFISIYIKTYLDLLIFLVFSYFYIEDYLAIIFNNRKE